jgi:hypothetical protein
MENSINQLTNILQSSSLLSDYVSKVKTLEKLTQIVRQYLEPELAKNCIVANLSNNILILATTSAAWNHKLRFLTPDLINKLRNLPQYYGLASIEIIQQQPIEKAIFKTKLLNPIFLSSENAKQIISVAEQISNKKLAGALMKIAKRGKH